MSIKPIEAWKFPLYISADAGATWILVDGVETMSHTHSDTTVSTNAFSNNGKETFLKTADTESYKYAGHGYYDTITGVKDAGQALCETYSLNMGTSAELLCRVDTPSATVTKKFTAIPSVNSASGGVKEASKWEVTLKVTGQTVIIARPA